METCREIVTTGERVGFWKGLARPRKEGIQERDEASDE